MSIPQLKMRPEVARKWVDALRSGRYAQGKHRLTTITDDGGLEHCCLGVLCQIAVEEGVIPQGKADEVTYLEPRAIEYGAEGAVAVPPIEVNQWAFPDFDKDAVENREVVLWTAYDRDGNLASNWPALQVDGHTGLTEINDVGAADFERIAQLVEATHCAEVAV